MIAPPKKSDWTAFAVVAAVALAAYAYVFLTSASLPVTAATHFNIQGDPNAMSSWTSYRAFMALLIIGMPLLIAGVPAIVARRWPQLLNIPNREFWLASERIGDTQSSLRARMAVLAIATIALQCFVHRLVLGANAADRPELDQQALLIGLGIFAAFMIGWIISLWRRFRTKTTSS